MLKKTTFPIIMNTGIASFDNIKYYRKDCIYLFLTSLCQQNYKCVKKEHQPNLNTS